MAAGNDKFCLKWNDFETNVSTAFKELREDGDFFDVTLACDGNQLEAHKVILSACSPFFRGVLKRNPHAHPLLYLKGVKYDDMVAVLNFMYHGEVNIAQAELASFLAVAEDLQVKGLTKELGPGGPPAGPPPEPPGPRPPKQRRLSREPDPGPAAGVLECSIKEEAELEMEHFGGEGEAGENPELHYQEMAQAMAEGTVGNDRNSLLKFITKIVNREGMGEDQFKCEICGKIGGRKDNVLNHVENTHFPGTFDYKCRICTKSMRTKKALENHVYRNHKDAPLESSIAVETRYVS